MATVLFALDQNFPQPVIDPLVRFQAHAELVPVRDIDPRMSELDDWELLLALHHHERPWAGLITTDSSMLAQARELATLLKTKLTLVVAMAAGHDPVRASGLLFAHLGNVAQRADPRRAQVFRLRARGRPADDPWNACLLPLAQRQGREASDLYAEACPTADELARNPLSG
ncbi:MAG TPA: hypothetical protein VNZ62_17975 [Capillimicrobium sp.]|nr:hypothetical protein [Capillimicrobium sp.]